MQLLGSSSEEEGHTKGLNFVKVNFELFKCNKSFKIPHVGFNSVKFSNDSILFNGLDNNSEFYFVHSYKARSSEIEKGHELTYSTCMYGSEFISSYDYKNIFGTQFHPEKSQTNGLVVLSNFINQDSC